MQIQNHNHEYEVVEPIEIDSGVLLHQQCLQTDDSGMVRCSRSRCLHFEYDRIIVEGDEYEIPAHPDWEIGEPDKIIREAIQCVEKDYQWGMCDDIDWDGHSEFGYVVIESDGKKLYYTPQ